MRIYLAGKIAARDWRHKLVANITFHNEYGSPFEGDSLSYDGNPAEFTGAEWPVLPAAVLGKWDYTGPYFVCGNHCSTMGANSHNVGADTPIYYEVDNHGEVTTGQDGRTPKEETVRLCLNAIKRSDMMFAWIDRPDCFGTLLEIGVAKHAGLYVAVAGLEEFRDFWFTYTAADWVYFNALASPSVALEYAVGAAGHRVLRALAKRDYRAYLKSPHWLALREKKLREASYRCQVCNSDKLLQVHHRTYERIGQELLTDLTVLCEKCHSKHHGRIPKSELVEA